MATREIKTIFSIDGTQKYTDAIRQINKEQQMYRSSMKASAAEMRAAGDTQGEMKVKADGLSKVLEAQRRVVDENKAALEFAKKQYGENSSVVSELQIKYDRSREALAKQSEEYRKVTSEIEKNNSVSKILQEQIDKNKNSLSVLNAQLEAGVAEYKKNGDAAGSLKFQTENLNDQIKLQKQIVQDSEAALRHQASASDSTAQETNDLRIEYEKARKELSQMEDKLQSTTKELYLNESGLNAAGDGAIKMGEKMQVAGDKINNAGSKLTMGVTAPIVAAGGLAIKSAMDFESAWAGVVKTVDATDNTSLEEIQGSLRELITTELPVTAEEMFGVAEAAGQLGISADNIVGFSETMVKMGQTTNISAQDAATSIAQFANITGMAVEDVDRFGASVVALGNNSATQEDKIVEFAMRLAGAGAQVNMSESDIVGFSAALASVGIEAEAGGSAFSKLLVNMQLAATTGKSSNEIIAKTGMTLRELQMFADADAKGFKEMANSMGYTSEEFRGFMDASSSLESFSKVTGKTAEEFEQAFKEDATGAVLEFIDGLSKAESQGTSAIEVLDGMGITEIRMRDALLRAAGASEAFTGSIELSSKAWEENTALTDEAAKRNETLESQFTITKNKIRDVSVEVGQKLAPTFLRLAESVADLVSKFSDLSPESQDFILKTIGIAAAAGPTLKVVGNLTKGVGALTSAFGDYMKKLAEKKAAEAAANATTSGMGTAMTGVASSGGLLLPVLAAVGIAVGALALTAKASEETLKGYNQALDDANETGLKMANSAAEWMNSVASATGVLDGVSDVWTASSEAAAQWDAGISEAQKKIIGIAETAAAETRAYTEEEKRTIEELIGAINVYTDKKIEAIEESGNILEARVKYEKDITVAAAAEYTKTAENLRLDRLVIAENEYNDAIAAANTLYGALGEKDQVAYDAAISTAQQKKDERVRIADEEMNGILGTITDKFLLIDQAKIDSMAKVGAAYEEYMAADKKVQEDTLSRAKGYAGELVFTAQGLSMDYSNSGRDLLQNAEESLEGLTAAWNTADENSAGSIIAMLAQAELFGVKIDESASTAAKNFIKSFDALPDDAKKKAIEVYGGMLQGFEEAEPDLYTAVGNGGDGIINTLQTTLDVNSPSKRAVPLGAAVTEGLEVGMDERKQSLLTKAQNIASSVVNRLLSPLGFHVNSPSKKTIPIGKSVTEGIEVGAEEQLPDLEKQMVEISNAAQAALDKKKINLGMDPISMSDIAATAAAARNQFSSFSPQGVAAAATENKTVTYTQYVTIERFENNRQSDMQQLSEQLGAYQQIQAKGKGA